MAADPEHASGRLSEREKDDDADAASNGSLSTADICYHYLTFETRLPEPAFKYTSPPGRPSIEAPNLTPFVSPFLWSSTRKSCMTWLSCIATALSAYTAGSYAPGQGQMMEEWHISREVATVGITVFTIGFGIAPMFLAPFSELNGRRPVFVLAGVFFVAFQLTCALTPTFAGMIVARFVTGCASSTFSTMVGGVVSDIYHAHDRNTAMSLFSGAAMFGTGLGPLVSGFLVEATTWRWIFYLQTIMNAVLMVVMIFFFSETRGSVLLSRKAKAINQYYDSLEAEGFYGVIVGTDSLDASADQKSDTSLRPQRIRFKVKADEERSSLSVTIYTSVSRPFVLLCTEPILFSFSLWVSFAWAVLYLLFPAVPLVFQTRHNFSLAEANAVFAATSIAGIIIAAVSICQDKLARKYAGPKLLAFLATPEGRLLFCCFQSVLLPLGCFWFGWTSFSSIPWIVPALAVGCVTMGVFSIYLCTFNYLADAYGKYASSALAAQSFCRNMLAGIFPVVTQAMFNGLTYQGAGSLLGGIAALLTLVPWTLALFGPRIRAKSKVCREVMEPRTNLIQHKSIHRRQT